MWPSSAAELVALQRELAGRAASVLAGDPWSMPAEPVVGGCFAAFEEDDGWVAAVAWRPGGATARRADRHLRGARKGLPRRADDVAAQAVVAGRAAAAYVPGLLALREGPLLAAAVAALDVRPDVLLVDASGADHPRRAGLALHLGAVTGVPTVGVTRRPLAAAGSAPAVRRRGATSPLHLGGDCVAHWVCTRTGARPLVAHAGWRTGPETAVAVVLAASTEGARTPVPLQEARRVAREARTGVAMMGR